MLTTRLIIEERQMRKDMTVEEARREAKLLVDAGQGSRAADKYNEALELQKKLFGLERPRAAELLGERSEEHTSELQSPDHLVCRLLLEKKKKKHILIPYVSSSHIMISTQLYTRDL